MQISLNLLTQKNKESLGTRKNLINLESPTISLQKPE